MPRTPSAPIFTRNGRHYFDGRHWSDVGGRKEPLIAPGEKLATKDPIVAKQLAARRVKELESMRRDKSIHGVAKKTTLGTFAEEHLRKKATESDITDQWLEQAERHLRTALGFFGDVPLTTITVERVEEYAEYLTTLTDRRGRPLGPGTRRHYLNSLSNLFHRAQGRGYTLAGYNPVKAMASKPAAKRKESHWLEVPDAALLLEAARTYTAKRKDAEGLHIYEIMATFLLTGGRESEVLGLAVDDISFDRQTVTFRPHPWRRLKTLTSHRTVPLWPQLEEILRPYVFGSDSPPGRLLFSSYRGSKEGMITDLRKVLDAVAERAGWKPGEIRTKAFRHTYCATRLQTTDRGAPVSEFTVAREMGHGGFALVRRVYGHLGTVRHRSEWVEYRVEQHRKVLGERLRTLQL